MKKYYKAAIGFLLISLAIARDIHAGRIGGVILFSIDVEQGNQAGYSPRELRTKTKSRNIQSIDQVRELNQYLTAAARRGGKPVLFTAIDQEGGAVIRIGPEHGFKTPLPPARDMAAMNMDTVADLYYKQGQKLSDLGFNLNFAPCTDVDINPQSPAIGVRGRAYSSDPERIYEYGHTAANAMARAGVLSSFKHFPGHGSATGDTHAGLVDITNTWKRDELRPYATVPATSMVMVAHVINGNIDPENPASLSPDTINKLLRGQMGYNGVVITDDLQMGAIYNHYGLRETLRRAILAGNDIMLLGNNLQYTENLGRIAHREIIDMVSRGEIPRRRIRESYKRILKLKKQLEKTNTR